MDIFLIIVGLVLGVVGLIGSILPALPGAPLNFGALFLLYFINWGADPSPWAMAIFGILTVASLAIDYLLPARIVKGYGATRAGVVGAFLGMLIGFVVLNFIGLLIGTFLGAVLGEMLSGKKWPEAAKAGAAGVSGNLLAMLFKLLLALGMLVYFLVKLF